jgi:hypothetical protein
VADPAAPSGDPVLRVFYGKGSSANSCTGCPEPGGGQFYTSLASLGQPDVAAASVLYLSYYVKFPVGFDFGRGGKLPGLSTCTARSSAAVTGWTSAAPGTGRATAAGT